MRDDIRKPRNAALRVDFPALSGRQKGLMMRRYRRRLSSYRENRKDDHKGCLLVQVGIDQQFPLLRALILLGRQITP